MATAKNTKDESVAADEVVNPLAGGGDHDRVVMLSVNADGSLDQTNPEIIGDKEQAIEATKRQFAEQAVAAVDATKRPELGLGGSEPVEPGPDAKIDELKAAHDEASKAAEQRAETVVDSLHKG
jgi:hypothetical protein